MTFRPFVCLLFVASALAQPGAVVGVSSPPQTPPYGSVFTAPVVANPCRSAYDRFYSTQRGVYAYWPLCESGDQPGQDYAQDAAGTWDLVRGINDYPYGYGGTPAQVAGPVPDGEKALNYGNSQQAIKNDGFVINRLAGTIAAWVNGGTTGSPISYVFISGQPYTESSYIKLARCSGNQVPCAGTDSTECFYGEWHNNTKATYFGNTVQKCGYTTNTWHRLVLAWAGTVSGGTLTLAVDGVIQATGPYTGQLDDSPMLYQLFGGYTPNTVDTTLAKVSVSRVAWTAAEIATDFAPTAVITAQTPPVGGVVVEPVCNLAADPQCAPTVHQDVLGLADGNVDLTTPGQAALERAGYQALGIKAVRLNGGITGDGTDFIGRSAVQCVRQDRVEQGGTTGAPLPANYVAGQDGQGDTLDAFMTQIGTPLGLDILYQVPYGSNPPACNAGGDPIVNGANVAAYILGKGYPVAGFQVGNEQWALTSNIDYHANPYYSDLSKPSSYAQAVSGTSAPAGGYEAPFYTAIKSVMPSAVVDVPFPTGFGKDSTIGNTYLWPLMAAKNYDAIDIHIYPYQSSNGPDPNHNGFSDNNILYPELRSAGSGVRGLLVSSAALLASYGKYPYAIHVGEWDFAAGGGAWSVISHSLSSALASATMLAEYAHDGVSVANWWAHGSGNGCSPNNVDGHTPAVWRWDSVNCGTHALFWTGSVGSQGHTSIGMKPGDLYPAGRGFQVVSRSGYMTEGEHSLLSFTDATGAPWLNAFAVTHGSGYAVLLVNRDPVAAHIVPVKLPLPSWMRVTQTTYGAAQFALTAFGNWSVGPATSTYAAGSGIFQATLPAESVSVLIVQ